MAKNKNDNGQAGVEDVVAAIGAGEPVTVTLAVAVRVKKIGGPDGVNRELGRWVAVGDVVEAPADLAARLIEGGEFEAAAE